MSIVVRGARTHNLRDIDVTLPTQALVAITGPSGSGKSSLAFDTIHAEAQRRYLEALAGDVSGLLSDLPKPAVDAIEGLPPTLALRQQPPARSARGTLGTLSEVSDVLRVLYARSGTAHCPRCQRVLRAETTAEIVDRLLALPVGAKVLLLAPIVRQATRAQLAEPLARLRSEGMVRVSLDGTVQSLDDLLPPEARRPTSKERAPQRDEPTHSLEAVVDRLVIKADGPPRSRAADSVELALKLSGGLVGLRAELPDGSVQESRHADRLLCEQDQLTLPALEPALFSFNTPLGRCPACDGLGTRWEPERARVLPDPSRSLRHGAIAAWGPPGTPAFALELARAVHATGADPDLAFAKLPKGTQAALLDGRPATEQSPAYDGVLAWVRAVVSGQLEDVDDEVVGPDDAELRALGADQPCARCQGSRLREEARAVRVAGRSIDELGRLRLGALSSVLSAMESDLASLTEAHAQLVTIPLLGRVRKRVTALVELGLDYLQLDRPAPTLKPGEAMRARLATQLSSGLKGVLYVLDEPSLGMHPADRDRLLAVLRRLVAEGSGVLLVEHDLGLIGAADHLIELGPGAGERGGRLLGQGSPDERRRDPTSPIGPWLAGQRTLPAVQRLAPDPDRQLRIEGAALHDLRDVDVRIPLGRLVCVVGPSGSGKGTLVHGVLVPSLEAELRRRGARRLARPASSGRSTKKTTARTPAPAVGPGEADESPSGIGCRRLHGAESIEHLRLVDQAPLGRSRRGSPASYLGILEPLRDLFASLPEAKARGYGPGRFSLRVKGGRCEACRGEGHLRVPMHTLPDAWVPCSVCHGSGFDRETLQVRYRGHHFADVLGLRVQDAQPLFDAIPPIRDRLAALAAVGLGYLVLGQASSTLSGGEAQRVKLARELALGPNVTGPTLFVLDEPTTGLHPEDVSVLLEVLISLRDRGHSLVVIEHDPAFLERADWWISMGPGSGELGGRVTHTGPPAT